MRTMANWKGLLAVVLNAYDLTSFVTVSTKEVCFKTEILHIFFKKWVIHMSKYFQSENQEFLIWGSRRCRRKIEGCLVLTHIVTYKTSTEA